jgi:NAD(P)-dependent dehydrogenase (short-subunit alcohol dehydrogenase family)
MGSSFLNALVNALDRLHIVRGANSILKGQSGENTDAMKEQFNAMIPMGRLGRPAEIAAAAVFLASEESRFIAGIDLPVDGGVVAV